MLAFAPSSHCFAFGLPHKFACTQASLAQLVEHFIRNERFAGSNPVGGSNKKGQRVLPFLFWVVRTFNPGEGYRKEQKPIPAYCFTIFLDEMILPSTTML